MLEPPATSRPPAPPSAQRLGEELRASLAYVRDTIEITRGERDLLDAWILTAALDANMAPVTRDPALMDAYGRAAESTPDDLRRPVSVNAVAQSLRLPFETVRRRVLRLAREGHCVVGPHGVVVPNSAVTTDLYLAEMQGRQARARRFHQQLKTIGALPAEPASAPASGEEPPLRAVNWALSEYVLRACNDLIALTDNLVASRVLLELAVSNIETLPAEDLPGWAADPAGVGRPARTAALARSLRVPAETVRRHLNGLEAQGYGLRRADGWVATAPADALPRLSAMAQANRANLKRLFSRLRTLGALAAWEGAPA
ncbi:hypothetical protein [Caulobacter endophyticus]|uniref:hypothetical protein n=1 Tax=Caulobacter endophyticus TaxID=2172652 RepID=UPI00241022AB|nr:hypothetical protein [Caulobacter endophyticus]MDG2530854.1 hypothetical protein [Caulobacter endophyticus]